MKLGKRWLPAHILVWTYAVLLVVPLYYFLASAFKSNDEIFAHPFAPPSSLGLGNFRTAFESADLGLAVVNSALVTVFSLALTLLLAIPASFALARSTGRLAGVVEKVFSLGFLIPRSRRSSPPSCSRRPRGCSTPGSSWCCSCPRRRCRCRW